MDPIRVSKWEAILNGEHPEAAAQAAVAAASNSVTMTAAEEDEEIERLAQWNAEFMHRMATKQQEREKRLFEQSLKAGTEIDAQEERRQQREKLEAEKLAEEERLAEHRRREREAEEARVREETYYDRMTAGMSPRHKAQWIADQQELDRLERDVAEREGRIATLSDHLNGLVAVYEQRLKVEEEERRRREEEEEEERRRVQKMLQDEQDAVSFAHAEGSQELEAEEIADREALKTIYISSGEAARLAARNRVYNSLPPEERSRVDSSLATERDAYLDELLEVDVLREKLKKQVARAYPKV